MCISGGHRLGLDLGLGLSLDVELDLRLGLRLGWWLGARRGLPRRQGGCAPRDRLSTRLGNEWSGNWWGYISRGHLQREAEGGCT